MCVNPLSTEVHVSRNSGCDRSVASLWSWSTKVYVQGIPLHNVKKLYFLVRPFWTFWSKCRMLSGGSGKSQQGSSTKEDLKGKEFRFSTLCNVRNFSRCVSVVIHWCQNVSEMLENCLERSVTQCTITAEHAALCQMQKKNRMAEAKMSGTLAKMYWSWIVKVQQLTKMPTCRIKQGVASDRVYPF